MLRLVATAGPDCGSAESRQNAQMSRLGREYIRKLPPGAVAHLRRSLASYRKAARAGIRLGIKILPPSNCPVAISQEGTEYAVDRVPELPLPGCKRVPCCGCCYSAEVKT